MSKIHRLKGSEEWVFESDQYILSETDSKGFILYANDVFCEMAGYTQEELYGQPHNIVRHPDMPRVAFEGLWKDVTTKGFWKGIVKNIRKDGGYYWVEATVLRKIDAKGEVTYLSIRRCPTKTDVQECTKLYAQLKREE